MSSDAKFWIARIGMFVCIIVDLDVLMRARGTMTQDNPHGSVALWAAFFVIAIAGVVASVFYYYFKAKRWQDFESHTDADRLALETLAKLDKQHAEEPDREKKP